jgi:fatty-acyl-CoA synthase
VKASAHNAGAWIARWAAAHGDRPALVDGRSRFDYRALEDRIERLVGWLRGAGIRPGDRVGILLANRAAYLEIVFAAARIGAISLPINLRLAEREIRFLFDDCHPAALFHEQALTPVVQRTLPAAASGSVLTMELSDQPGPYEAALAGAKPDRSVHPVHPDDPMLLMYTSGTTGAPKGALLPHRKTLFNSLNAQLYFAIRSDDRVLVAAPLFHSLGLLILALPALYAGGCVVLQRRFDPEAVWCCVESEGIAYFGGVPAMYQRLNDQFVGAGTEPYDLSSLRFLFTAGSAISPDLVRAFAKRGLVLVQGYGQTETSILSCLAPRDAVARAGSIGRPVFHAEVRTIALETIDQPPEAWRDIAIGETGEVVARGPITMLGYWERPAETAATLREGWVRTGDLARVDAEGFLTLAGRSDDMFISGGENVYPAEIEAVYLEHPAVREIAVVGVSDPKWGQVAHAHLVLAPGQTLDAKALRRWGAERLAGFKLPDRFLARETLPRTASGKIEKHRLLGGPPDS